MASLAEIVKDDLTVIHPGREVYEVVDFKRIEKFEIVGFSLGGFRGLDIQLDLGARGIFVRAAHRADLRYCFLDWEDAKAALTEHARGNLALIERLQQPA